MLGIVFWLPRGLRLDSFVATDEVAWLWRSANFYYLLGQRDFSATYLNKSPGVVTMWVGTAAFLKELPEYRGFGQGFLDKYMLLEKLLISKGVNPHDILVTSRTIMVFLNVLLVVAAFLFSIRLFGALPALVGFLLIAFDPFHLAITRLSHLDGPLSSFLFLSVLAFLDYLIRGRQVISLLVSAGAGGLAVLSKVPGLTIIPTVGLIAIANELSEWKAALNERSAQFKGLLNRLIKPLVLWGGVFVISIALFFPAMWTNPAGNLKKLVLSPLGFTMKIRDEAPVEEIGASEVDTEPWISVRPLSYYLRYPKGYLWRTTPLVLLGLLSALVFYFLKFSVFSEKGSRKALIGLLIYIVVYTAFLTIPPKSSAKYYSPVYPALDLIAGLGWFAFAEWIANRFQQAQKWRVPVILLSTVILAQAISSLGTFPYYFSYFNPLLGGGRKAGEVLFVGSGEGLDQAAEYLNQKPNAKDLKVMSWYGIGPFSYYFTGETRKFSYLWNKEKASELKDMDYMVMYNNQWHRMLPWGLFPLLGDAAPEHSIWIDGIEYARIYDVSKLPPDVFEKAKK